MTGLVLMLVVLIVGCAIFGLGAWFGDRHLSKAREGLDAQGRERVGL